VFGEDAPRNVLVVEDEEPISSLIRDVLEDEGYACLLARDIEAAEAILVTEPVAAMTLDHVLPGRDGIEWLEDLAETRPSLLAHTLVISGSDIRPSHRAILERHGVRLLPKPFRVAELVKVFRELNSR
jgi:DNA-binding response OmpR family regulator